MIRTSSHYSLYQLYGHTYRYYRANDTHWCLDVSRHDEGPARWEVIAYDADPHRVRLALLDVILKPQVPLVPGQTYTAVIAGRFSPRECVPHAETLRGHGFLYQDTQLRPAHWAKAGCDFAALAQARALAASLGLKYERRADQATLVKEAA